MVLTGLRAVVTGWMIARELAALRAALPPSMVARLDAVTFERRPRPTDVDRERGVTDDHRAYFWGHCIALERTTALPDERPPCGVIVLFTERIKLDRLEVTRLLLHEIAHALGYDHDVIEGDLCLI